MQDSRQKVESQKAESKEIQSNKNKDSSILVVPRTLSGFKDRLPMEAMAKSKLLFIVSRIFENFGFVPIETPHLEYADILVKQGSDEIQKELYRFKDHGGREVALRFDQTVPLARFISQHRAKIDLPFKRYAIGNVFRGERAQKGRYREFTQCDFDFIGSNSIACDAEIVQVIYASMVALGIEEFTIWLNNRKILNGICEYFGITKQSDISNVLRIIDKLDKIGEENIIFELTKITNEENARNILKTTSIKQSGDIKEFFNEISYLKDWNDSLKTGIEELENICEILSNLQMDIDSYRINFSIARGLGYYTGIVYETTLNRQKDIGSVCSGGRYDNLTRSFSQEKISGVGASIGIDRLLVAMESKNKKQTSARVLIICLNQAHFGYAYKIAESFRRSTIPTEVYPEISKLKKQFAYANAKGHEFVVVIGDDELKVNGITLKNMTSGMQIKGLSLLKAIQLLKE
ncbi:histidine--tRNA ligase [Helicobacter sp. 16-1353]|uniref:histidine--tRNA ligase n=1 Tax=Helicobacter sp. 16-1353 TaxID=2004996 RepID=UPI000DCE29DF|nr:histidine--tRNA ligase [Helicobacter sp. 16-1353]RAX54840.1 histidine--tRNA ligase [Helicobacter sp. 16-1353]